ncbi:MAG: methionine--tRNA ligase [SAR86 cluster bacterium]|uniref:Methionine--tRNA ligase n=1 Tax=SAR86 cluster bacterium TaxID=2030880 RepID=A0A520MZV3_9GAMM|nr:MAG: methionine--tRNA ligase [SAR86 cluster bacterium]|tara:strand:+ start:3886 stop:5841 length:1956 start_codon:yes stop_codon:yes gene_type:complete
MDIPTKNSRKILVTQALPYANAPLHLGHILEAVQTDIWTRFQNLIGNQCYFFCADDTHGTPVMLKAKELGITPEDLIKDVYEDHKETYKLYGINFTNFYSTHSEENKKYSEKIYLKAKKNNLISKQLVEQLYDEKEEMFLSDRFIKGSCPKCGAPDQHGDNCSVCGASYDVLEIKDPISILSNTKPIKKQSEHIFFDLPEKTSTLKKFLNESNLQKPIKNKLKEWLSDDLKKWDISRDEPYFGFNIPGEDKKFFYVWVDAPIGYIASMDNWFQKNNLNTNDIWSKESDYEIYHFIGKDIAYFHGLFWPALLSSADFKLPDGVFVHGFLTVNGEKMSKSKGTGILARNFAEICDPETLRYYLAAKLNNKVEDIDLNFDDYVQRINSDLVGKYLNIASRCASFLKKDKNNLSNNIDDDFLKTLTDQKETIIKLFEDRNYSKVIRLIMELADSVNKYINIKKPWEKDLSNALEICSTALNAFKIISIYLSPIIPNLANNAYKFLNLTNCSFDDVERRISGKINDYKSLLNRLEPIIIPEEETMENQNIIDIKQFSAIDLRVAKIIKAENVEGADKLLQLTLDVGELGIKNVFAGIKSSYNPKDLDNRMVILVNNLAPRKMKFGNSEGMVLASSNGEGIYLISPDEGAEPGMKVK